MAKWTYLLVYSTEVGSYERVKRFLDQRPEILNWVRYMPHTFIIVSDKTAPQLAAIFRKLTNGKGRFLILDTQTDRDGWLPKAAWDLMRNPKAAWED